MTSKQQPGLALQALESEIDLVRGNLSVVRKMGDQAAVQALEERLEQLLKEFDQATGRARTPV